MWYFVGILGFILVYFFTLSQEFAILFLDVVLVMKILSILLTEKLKDKKQYIGIAVSFLYQLISYFLIKDAHFVENALFAFTFAYLLIDAFTKPPSLLAKNAIAGMLVVFVILVIPFAQLQDYLYAMEDVSFKEKVLSLPMLVYNVVSNTTYDFLNSATGINLEPETENNEEKTTFDPHKYLALSPHLPKLDVQYDDILVYPELQISLSFGTGDASKLKKVKLSTYNGKSMNSYGANCGDSSSFCSFEREELIKNENFYEFASFKLPNCNFKDSFYVQYEFIGATRTNANYYVGTFKPVSNPDMTAGLAGTAIQFLPESYNYPGKGDAEFLLKFITFVINRKEKEEALIPFIKVIVPSYVDFENSESCIIEKEETQGDQKAYILKVKKSCVPENIPSSFVCRVKISEEDVKDKEGTIMSISIITPYKFYGFKNYNFELKDQSGSCKSQWKSFLESYFEDINLRDSPSAYVAYVYSSKLLVPLNTAIEGLMDKCLEMYDGLNGKQECFYVRFSTPDKSIDANSKEENKEMEEENLDLGEQSSIKIKNEKIYKIVNDVDRKKSSYVIKVYHEKHCSVEKVIAVIE